MLYKFIHLFSFSNYLIKKNNQLLGNRHPSLFKVIGYYFEQHSTILENNRFESICPKIIDLNLYVQIN